MFETSISNAINSVSGTIVKSHPKSYFMLGHVNSSNTLSLMGAGNSKVVLQAMLVGDKYLMYEVVDKDNELIDDELELTDDELEILDDMPALKYLAMKAGLI